MNLLVTGGAGFIGSNFIRLVLGKPEIAKLVCLDCLTYAGHMENLADVRHHPKFTFAKVDLRDKGAVVETLRQDTITHVIHLAAESHVDRSITGPDPFIHTNVLGTFHLLEACRSVDGGQGAEGRGQESGVRGQKSDPGPRTPDPGPRFLHVSTDEVFGALGNEGRFTEESPYAPNSPYSASKAAADMMVRAYHRTYGLPVMIANGCNNYGPYQYPEKLIPLVIQKLMVREPVPVYGDGTQMRDWIYVDDHAEALWQILTRGRVGQRYNVGADEEWPNIEVVELLCDLMDDLKPDLGGDSRKLIQLVADRPGHDWRYAIDASKLRREFGWKPRHEFRNALRKTVHWYLENQAWVKAVGGR